MGICPPSMNANKPFYYFGIITLFPEMFGALTGFGINRRALESGLYDLELLNPRDFSDDPNHRVDTRPYGGGPGMVMACPPLAASIEASRARLKEKLGQPPKVVYLSPQGRPFSSDAISHFQARRGWIFISGRYEGIDERILDEYVDEEWSLGNFVLSGGELAIMTILDSLIRFIPGALGHDDSALEDSFQQDLLDCPHYARPETFHNRSVPPVLLSGDHKAIATWRRKQSLGRTWLRQPGLLSRKRLSAEDQSLLEEFITELEAG